MCHFYSILFYSTRFLLCCAANGRSAATNDQRNKKLNRTVERLNGVQGFVCVYVFANEYRINEEYALSAATRFNSISIFFHFVVVHLKNAAAAAVAVAGTENKQVDKNIKLLTRAHLFSVLCCTATTSSAHTGPFFVFTFLYVCVLQMMFVAVHINSGGTYSRTYKNEEEHGRPESARRKKIQYEMKETSERTKRPCRTTRQK